MVDFSKKLKSHRIDSFKGEYDFLSNFHPAVIRYEGQLYHTVEHAYQCAKTLDQNQRDTVLFMRDSKGIPERRTTPAEAKHAGRRVTLRKDWDDVKVGIMSELLQEKFKAPKLAQLLKATGNAELVEGNTWNDTYWGVCNGVGANVLGELLMQIRSELKSGGY